MRRGDCDCKNIFCLYLSSGEICTCKCYSQNLPWLILLNKLGHTYDSIYGVVWIKGFNVEGIWIGSWIMFASWLSVWIFFHWLLCGRQAWQKLGAMPPEEAMQKYIDIVTELYPSWLAGSTLVRIFLFSCLAVSWYSLFIFLLSIGCSFSLPIPGFFDSCISRRAEVEKVLHWVQTIKGQWDQFSALLSMRKNLEMSCKVLGTSYVKGSVLLF